MAPAMITMLRLSANQRAPLVRPVSTRARYPEQVAGFKRQAMGDGRRASDGPYLNGMTYMFVQLGQRVPPVTGTTTVLALLPVPYACYRLPLL